MMLQHDFKEQLHFPVQSMSALSATFWNCQNFWRCSIMHSWLVTL